MMVKMLMAPAGLGMAMILGWITAGPVLPMPGPPARMAYVIPTPLPTTTMVPFAPHGTPRPMGMVQQNLRHMGIPSAPPNGVR